MSRKKKKVKFLDKSDRVKCWGCDGKGYHRKRNVAEDCELCDGTGIWVEPNYILIAEKPDGQKIAFQSDTGAN